MLSLVYIQYNCFWVGHLFTVNQIGMNASSAFYLIFFVKEICEDFLGCWICDGMNNAVAGLIILVGAPSQGKAWLFISLTLFYLDLYLEVVMLEVL